MNELDLALLPRWRGQHGRLEVHYLTATDMATGSGLWLHHEVVAPISGEPYGHGWIATFPLDASPRCERFGPSPVQPLDDGTLFRTSEAVMTPTGARGRAGDVEWDLRWETAGRPLWTFPRWAWQRQILPAAQVVPVASTRLTGTVGATSYDAIAGIAHINGHGNAKRWVWLHADLGDGDVLEIVAATARRPGMRLLPMLPLVQLRHGGKDWPRDPLAAAPFMRAAVHGDRFTVTGIVGTRRLRVAASLPAERCVVLDYTDPDGASATCTNTERADVSVGLDKLTPRGWAREQTWTLDGTAHAEIGTRP